MHFGGNSSNTAATRAGRRIISIDVHLDAGQPVSPHHAMLVWHVAAAQLAVLQVAD